MSGSLHAHPLRADAVLRDLHAVHIEKAACTLLFKVQAAFSSRFRQLNPDPQTMFKMPAVA